MMRSFLRSLPDSRLVLRGLMWLTVFVGVLFLPSSLRNAARLSTEQHQSISLWVALTPWLLISISALFGTISKFEDPLFRRRVVAIVTLASVFPIIGAVLHYAWPAFRLPTFGFFSVMWGLFWVPQFFDLKPFEGVGAWIDPWVTRWFGPPAPGETAMREREQQIRRAAAQEERNRLAQDLHDSIKQEIFAIHTSAATAEARLATDPDGTRQALDQIRNSSRDAMTEMEALLDRLNPTPLENTGLVAALRKQCEALALRTGASVDCHIGTLPESSQLPQGAHEALFRIAQEALTNIGKHARADRVSVNLELGERVLLLTIRDNGQGFEPWGKAAPMPGMGLANMRARAESVGGKLGLVTSPGNGVVIRVVLAVMSKADFGFREMTTGQKWLMYWSAAVIGIPILAIIYVTFFEGIGSREFVAIIALLFLPRIAIEALRKRFAQKRITP